MKPEASSHPYPEFSEFTRLIQQRVHDTAPELAYLLSDYEGEAQFGYSVIQADLAALPRGAKILEIGAGMSILSCYLQQQGFRVTALEPVGEGFSHFDTLRNIVLDCARTFGDVPELCTIAAESMQFESVYDFAFSINVMEHVQDVGAVIYAVMRALKTGCRYHFLCPNYTFPYEPHFNIPMLFSKKITFLLLRQHILGSSKVVDPAGTWASLNGISVQSVRSLCRSMSWRAVHFDQTILYRFIQRTLFDPGFQARRGWFIKSTLRVINKLGIVGLSRYIPVGLQPAMSCTIIKS